MCYNFAKFKKYSLPGDKTMSSISVIAQKIVDSWIGAFYYPGDNELFECLYDAYCKLDDQNHNFGLVRIEAMEEAEKYCGQRGLERCFDKAEDKISGVNAKTCRKFYTGTCAKTYNKTCKKVYRKAYRKLVHWYQDKYPASKEDNSGIDRKITSENIKEGTYSFDEPLTSDSFLSYLIDGKPLRSSDARSFILHTAVAFLLSPEKLDHLLVTCGFHPLHVRSVQDMAIYVVLQDAAQNWTPEERRERNPFQEVRDVYESARLLLLQPQAAEFHKLSEGEQAAFRSDSTRVVQQFIHGQNLSRENLLAYVGNHTEFYNLRHHRLLTEHKRLVNLFSELYMRGTWYGDEAKYSLYEFLAAYCKSFERRRFKDQVYWYVDKYGRHPTWEFMIVLWIYVYCFLFCPEVLTPCDFSQVIPFRRTTQDPGLPLEQPFFEYFDKKRSCLKVLEYLSDTRDRASPLNGFYDGMTVRTTFKGNELVAFINSKLADYAWRQLDGRNAFDRSILSLSPLTIIMHPDGAICSAYYDSEPIDNAQEMNADNVPGSLVVIFKLLQKITDLGNARMPLPCNMYELI